MNRERLVAVGCLALLVFAATLHGGESRAQCTTAGTTATCTGDPGAISYTDGSITDVIIESLTADINDTTGVELTTTGTAGIDGTDEGETGGDGDPADDLSVDATLDTNTIVSTDFAIEVTSTGGSGGAGGGSSTSGTTGGVGGNAAAAGMVSVTVSGSDGIQANGGVGIQAESIGGAGGVGGDAGPTGGNEGDYVGGAGGDGGDAADVAVALTDGQALTLTDGETGIRAASLGGDGGVGGAGDNGTDDGDAIGGDGGDGGDAGDATLLAISAPSQIEASTSHGVFIESLGGDGGDGGSHIESSLGTARDGDGGDGGDGGDVIVALSAAISGSGDSLQGVYARSLGGEGGAGDTGGAGGDGGLVGVFFAGSITRDGSEANGIFAQSVGGFAGETDTSDFVGYGAGETSDGDGGTVAVVVGAGSTISTEQDFSAGVDAMSIGGGGGKGSSASDGFTTLGGVEDAVGGMGGTVSVSVIGSTIGTEGLRSYGVSALSVGGTGGDSGSNTETTSVGGTGGDGGDGGTVNVNLVGSTITSGADFSAGVYGSSVGGGGGNGHSTSDGINRTGGDGGDGGAGGDVIFLGSGSTIGTNFLFSEAVHLQSVGGGGGNGSNSVTVQSSFGHEVGGGDGGAGGAGGDITFVDVGGSSITTMATHSRGLFAQSVGGGGGNAGNSLTTSIDFGLDLSTGSSAQSSGGAGSDGGTVDVLYGGAIQTSSDFSTGLKAQSVGGSGGSGGTTVEVSVDTITFTDGHSHNVGSDGGDGGSGGAVTVVTTGGGTAVDGTPFGITTQGDLSDGIHAQSVGGSGGTAGAVYSFSTDIIGATSITFGDEGKLEHNVGTGGAGGDGGAVSVVSASPVMTNGASANGILAQSVAGGGGKGGLTLTVDTFDGGVNNTVGSSGGSGGQSGIVDVVSTGDITTGGSVSHGILAQSIGGSGGAAGTTANVSAFTAALDDTVGADGGDGGNASLVFVDNAGTIQTTGGIIGSASDASGSTGDNSAAIVAQSIGGGGGNGGSVYDVDASVIGTASLAVGGTGGDGGTGGAVVVSNVGGLASLGSYSYGILGQSIGGSGGNGGTVVNVTASAGVFDGNLNLTFGGDGGDGGASSMVDIANSGTIETAGFGATGIIGQSIGGSGGVGGSVLAGSIAASSEASVQITASVGGDGGDGGTSDNVEIVNDGAVTTTGHFSDAIFAQAISGNGGAGGNSYAAILTITEDSTVEGTYTIGGDGGDSGGTAGDVSVFNDGTLSTSGGNSYGIYAQSIGGNGGDGGSGYAILADFGSSEDMSLTGTVTTALGGTGGSGNNGGEVLVQNTGQITTVDAVSRAIYAQSVGGGGGDGGSAGQFSIGYTEEPEEGEAQSYSFTFDIGGSGGSAGAGDAVTVENSGALETSGTASYGIFAQSVGGGGGNGGDGNVFDVGGWVADAADIVTEIEEAKTVYDTIKDPTEVFSEYSVAIGGTGGSAGTGGDVSVTNSNTITTTGTDATAIYAQSVGGGGGAGGDGSQGVGLNFSLQGGGADGSAGGTVTVVNSSDTITTSGARALGIIAQSVGGGGGSSGDLEVSAAATVDDLNIGSAIYDSETAGGNGEGETVAVTTGSITTEGVFAHGVFAQSAGGGGGGQGAIILDENGDESDYSGSFGSGTGNGDGGDVTVTVDGDVAVSGAFAVGVIAQSVGGGSSGSTSGTVTVDVDGGSISASGTDGRAILAQSEGQDSSGDVVIILQNGATVSSSNGGDGYDTVTVLDGGTNSNSITIDATSTLENTSDNDSSNVIYTSGGVIDIDVSGVLTGSLSLGSGANSLTIEDGGTFNMGTTVDLGSTSGGSTFSNGGTMSPGGVGTIATTTLTAANAISMTDTGIYWVDWSYDSTTDNVTSDDFVGVSGSMPAVDFDSGTVTPNVVGTSLPSDSSTSSFIIATADGGIDDVSSVTVTDSATVDYELSRENSNTELLLNYTVDYSGVGDDASLLTDNHMAFAGYLSDLVELAQDDLAGGGTNSAFLHTAITAILNTPDTANLMELYEHFVGDKVGAVIQAGKQAAQAFHESLQSCPAELADGRLDYNRQGECVWVRGHGGHYEQHGASDRTPYDQYSYGVHAGGQVALSYNTFLGLGAGVDWRDIDGAGFEEDAVSYRAGGVVKHEIGDLTLAAGLSGGVYETEIERTTTTLEGTTEGKGDPMGGYVAGEVRAAHTIRLSNEGPEWYVKPMAGVTVVQLWQEGYTEKGDSDFHLKVDSIDHTAVAVRPALEAGAKFQALGGSARLFARAGATFFVAGDDTTVRTRFAAAPGEAPWLKVSHETDSLYGDFAAGLDVQLEDLLVLSVSGDASVSDTTLAYGGQAKLRRRF